MESADRGAVERLRACLVNKVDEIDPSFDPGVQRFLIKILRHELPRLPFGIDERGWASIHQVLGEINRKFQSASGWQDFDHSRLAELVEANTDRIEMVTGRIRARYGHSRPVIVGPPAIPPATLLRATPTRLVPQILTTGLLPRGRNLVHLTTDRDYARLIGSRTVETMTMLMIETKLCKTEQCKFYQATDHVWQTHCVPPKAIGLLSQISVL